MLPADEIRDAVRRIRKQHLDALYDRAGQSVTLRDYAIARLSESDTEHPGRETLRVGEAVHITPAIRTVLHLHSLTSWMRVLRRAVGAYHPVQAHLTNRTSM